MGESPELLQRFARGDVEAFEGLFRQFQGQVFGWVVRIVRDRGVAEDLTIETFWRIHQAHARFDPKRNFGAWARRIATNAALDYLKTSRREMELPDDLPAPFPPDPSITKEVRERVGRAFHALPPKLRVAALLALIEDESHAGIAAALGISVGAVKLRVFRAIRLLRKQLKETGVEP